MPHKIIPLGPWRRDNNYYAENIVLDATQVTPMSQGYRGGYSVYSPGAITVSAAEIASTPMHAFASNAYIYFTVYGATATGKIYKSAAVKNAGAMPTAFTDITPTDIAKWTGDKLATITRYGNYVVFGSLVDKIQYYEEGSAMTEADVLVLTTAPTGSTAGATADIKARFVATYKEHLVAAHITMAANYPASNTIFANNNTYDSLVWLSMTDNIRRFASPVAHPEVRGSVPLQLLDDGGPITGIVGGEECYIFKELAVYRLVGPPFDLVRISKDIGTISPKSIVEVAGTVYFMSNMGLAVIDGGQVRPVAPEMFVNAIRSAEHTALVTNRWAYSTHYMLPDLLQTSDEMKYIRGAYSDDTGCITWVSESGDYFMMNVSPPYGMSHGKTIKLDGNGLDPFQIITYALARSSGDTFFTVSGDSSWTNNFFFFKSNEDNYDKLRIGVEKYSGFGNNSTSFPIQFTTPMVPLGMTDKGIVVTRPTGFRIVGEGAGDVTKVAVRSVKAWNDAPVVTGHTGSNLVSRDGWVSLPDSYAGRFHSISFQLTTDTYLVGESEKPSMPFFLAIDVAYEEVPSRSG